LIKSFFNRLQPFVKSILTYLDYSALSSNNKPKIINSQYFILNGHLKKKTQHLLEANAVFTKIIKFKLQRA